MERGKPNGPQLPDDRIQACKRMHATPRTPITLPMRHTDAPTHTPSLQSLRRGACHNQSHKRRRGYTSLRPSRAQTRMWVSARTLTMGALSTMGPISTIRAYLLRLRTVFFPTVLTRMLTLVQALTLMLRLQSTSLKRTQHSAACWTMEYERW